MTSPRSACASSVLAVGTAGGPAKPDPWRLLDAPAHALRVAPARGFTLVELCVVLAVAGLLAAAAWPSYRSQLLRGYRADAVTALMRVQLAQESHRNHHGLYAAQLKVLIGAASPISGQGLYDIDLTGGGDRYEVRASARAGSVVASDSACAVLRLQVRDGLTEIAPSARCWNR